MSMLDCAATTRRALIKCRITAIMAAFVVIFCFTPSAAFGETSFDPDAMFSFADHLYEQNEFNAAIAEFARFMHAYPNDGRRPEAMFKTGMSHFRQGRYGRAIEIFDQGIRDDETTKWAFESAFMAAESYRRLNQSDEALARLDILTRETFDPAIRNRALYAIGWVLLEQREHAAAERVFDSISDQQRAFYQIDNLLKRLERRDELPTKSPVAAGIYSVVPGGGYLYTDRRSDALISFIFIAAGAGASYESFDNDLNVLGSILAITTLGFYSGSIYGSIGAAHKYNDRVYEDFVTDLRRNRPNPAAPRFSFHIGGGSISFNYIF
jgi:tetratricopeptide (TPR) repeat protein